MRAKDELRKKKENLRRYVYTVIGNRKIKTVEIISDGIGAQGRTRTA
jgi:hypothetical protein